MRRCRVLWFCCCLAPGVAIAPAWAQTLPAVTADVVVTATVTPVPAATVGRTVATVTGEDLRTLGVSSLVDGLRLLPGVDLRARGPAGVQTDLSLRGATFGQVLVLVDGIRLNNSQSGHHTAELPTTALAIDRIEVVAGPASAVHGADALGGTVQILTRRDRHALAEVLGGAHGTLAAQASAGGFGRPRHWTATAWGSRADGFMFARDHALGGAGLRGSLARGLSMDVRHQRRVFGANGFYGNSPSREWTSGTVLGLHWTATTAAWATQVRVAARDHDDRFRWDVRRPGFAENVHGTQALDLDLTSSRIVGDRWRLSLGAGAGGDRITSSNLGERRYGRGYGFAEGLWSPAPRVSVQVGTRVDHYSTFGTAWSPSLSAGFAARPGLRVRGSVARAFRIPTFTERFYTDPAHAASAALAPEHGWAVDAGVDATVGPWAVGVSPFIRWDTDVIDWVRSVPTDRWQTRNLHDVTTRGVEVAATRRWASAFIRAHYTRLDVDVPVAPVLSKYVLDYARQAAGLSLVMPMGRLVQVALMVDARDRHDQSGGQRYVLVGGRVTRPVGRVAVFVEGANLLDTPYREIAGVPMPGRTWSVGLRVR